LYSASSDNVSELAEIRKCDNIYLQFGNSISKGYFDRSKGEKQTTAINSWVAPGIFFSGAGVFKIQRKFVLHVIVFTFVRLRQNFRDGVEPVKYPPWYGPETI